MLLIPCPWCGLRSEAEFSFGGASVKFPTLDSDSQASAKTWHAAVHLRRNPEGNAQELWFHQSGCEHWFEVTRNTQTHEFVESKTELNDKQVIVHESG